MANVKPVDHVGVTFVNCVLGTGTYNNVINVQLGAFQFSNSEDGESVDPDLAVVSRLRMDEACALQLVNSLQNVLAGIQANRERVAESAKAEVNGDGGVLPKETQH